MNEPRANKLMLSLMSTRRSGKSQQRYRPRHSVQEQEPGHIIQQWRKLLCSSSNKAFLIKLLVDEWKGPKHREKLQNKMLYVTCDEVCYKLDKEQLEEVTYWICPNLHRQKPFPWQVLPSQAVFRLEASLKAALPLTAG